MGEFFAVLREQTGTIELVAVAVGLGTLTVLTDVTPSAVAVFGGVYVLVAIVNALNELPGVKGRALNVVLFAFGTFCGLYLTVTQSSFVMDWFTVVVGWLALDALYDTVHGIERTEPERSDLDEMGTSEASRMMYHAGKVQQALDNSPASLSASELVTRTELSENEVCQALSILEDSDAVLEERERYEINEDQPRLVRSTARRLVRPFSLFTSSR